MGSDRCEDGETCDVILPIVILDDAFEGSLESEERTRAGMHAGIEMGDVGSAYLYVCKVQSMHRSPGRYRGKVWGRGSDRLEIGEDERGQVRELGGAIRATDVPVTDGGLLGEKRDEIVHVF